MATHIKVRCYIYHDDATYEDLSARIQNGPSRRGNIDLGDWECDLVFDNVQRFIAGNLSLDPVDESSTLNQDGSSAYDPLLSENHEVKIWIDEGSGWEMFFQGYAGADVGSTLVDTKRHTVTFSPSGITGPIKEKDRMYNVTYRDRDLATSLLRSILLDSEFGGKLAHVVITDDPTLQVPEYITREGESTWNVLQTAIAKTGYILASRYHASGTAYNDGSGESTPEDGYYLTLYDPQRSKSTPDYTWSTECKSRKLKYSIDDVRTWVQDVYQTSTGRQVKTYPVMDDAQRAKFGTPKGDGTKLHRKMRLVNPPNSLIKDKASAEAFQAFALHDLSSPTPDTAIEIEQVYTDPKLHDLVRFVFHDYTIDVGVTGVDIDISPNAPWGHTTIRGVVDKVIGLRNRWLGQEMTEEEAARRRQEWLQGGASKLPTPVVLNTRRYTYQTDDGATYSALKIHWVKVQAYWYGYTGVFTSIGGNSQYGTEPTKTTRNSYVIVDGLPPGEKVCFKLRHFPAATMSPQGRR